MEHRGALHFDEALELIAALAEVPRDKDFFELHVTRTYSEDGWVKKKIISKQMSRTELIARLEWISNLDFGDDVDAWLEWRNVRQKEGFWSMR